MTLEEAIKRLTDLVLPEPSALYPRTTKAVKLGIKALERIKGLRSAGHYIGMPLLKGETKEK